MENIMVFDEKSKKRLGIIAFIPIICFVLCFIYYMSLIIPVMGGMHDPDSAVGVTSHNYTTMFIMIAISAIITAVVFIYDLVLLARLKNLNAETKLKWIIFLSVIAPVATALFWVFFIKDAPKYIGIYNDIA